MANKKVETSKTVSKKTQSSTKKISYYFTVGRRKAAVATVRMVAGGDHSFNVNGLSVEKYFPGELAKIQYLEPFKVTNTLGDYTVVVKVKGSGKNGQVRAVVHALSRALSLVDPDKFHSLLGKQGFLKRDPRTRERRKVGRGGKARRQKQSPKR